MSFLKNIRMMLLVSAFVAVAATGAVAGNNPFDGHSDTYSLPVNFSAKSLTHDDDAQTVTAIGDVELVQGEQILRADKIVYYLAEDKVTAIGNISLMDEKGDVHFAEYVELKDHMKDGFVQGLLTLLADGSRFTAAEAKRENNGTKTTMTDATYTVCHVCESDPHPLWQIKASKVVHDATDKTIDYKNARLEFLGIPVAYSPIFSHPDPTMKRKSGFLRPEYGWKDTLGTHIDAGYYYTISPDKDLTLHVEPTAKAGTVLKGQWRERFANGELQIDGNTANSDRTEQDGSVSTGRQRGSLFAKGLFDINDKWRSGVEVARVSDKQYLGFYDLYPEEKDMGPKNNIVLTSQVYAERFSGRDYSRVAAMSFEDIRLGAHPIQPDVLPMMEHDMIGEPGSLWGGRWEAGASVLGLTRDASNQDMQRSSLSLGWERRGTTSAGFSNVLRFDGRGDLYGVQDSDIAKIDPTQESNANTLRGIATAGFTSSYPLVKSLDSSQIIVEPIAGVNLSPVVSSQNNTIPNEDSIDVQFDANSLFNETHYPGLDREEDGGRANYGVKTGVYGDDGRYGKVFLGQQYRFYGHEIYPDGTGLQNRNSDYVGQLKLGLSKYLDADYQAMADGDTFKVHRHEAQIGAGNDIYHVETRYLYSAAMPSLGFADSRQQIQADATYKLSKTWTWRGIGLYDLGSEPGFRNATTSLDYADECFTFGILGSRNVADIASGDNESKILFRIGLKNIGEFSGPSLSRPVNSSTTAQK